MAKVDLTDELIRELIAYDPETGLVTSLVGGARRNRSTGAKTRCGYVRIYVGGAYYKAHRVAWLYMTGRWPSAIDHINGNGCDNRWANLREVTTAVNNENMRRARSDSVSGFLGVSKMRSGKFSATIRTTLAGKQVQLYLGAYATPNEASAVYIDAKRKLHAGCTI